MREEGSIKLVCSCGNRFFKNVEDRDTIRCPKCDSEKDLHHYRVRALREIKIVPDLADGPKTGTELEDKSSATRLVRMGLAGRYVLPGSKSRKSRKKSFHNSHVYFLIGDERSAMNLFIETYYEYVESCMEDNSNPLVINWSEEQYQLLKEQWIWNFS